MDHALLVMKAHRYGSRVLSGVFLESSVLTMQHVWATVGRMLSDLWKIVLQNRRPQSPEMKMTGQMLIPMHPQMALATNQQWMQTKE
jgi:hypothetical protein